MVDFKPTQDAEPGMLALVQVDRGYMFCLVDEVDAFGYAFSFRRGPKKILTVRSPWWVDSNNSAINPEKLIAAVRPVYFPTFENALEAGKKAKKKLFND